MVLLLLGAPTRAVMDLAPEPGYSTGSRLSFLHSCYGATRIGKGKDGRRRRDR
jgi:hypothetical protein